MAVITTALASHAAGARTVRSAIEPAVVRVSTSGTNASSPTTSTRRGSHRSTSTPPTADPTIWATDSTAISIASEVGSASSS